MHHVPCADEKISAFASVQVGSANKTLVLWSVVALEQSQTFEDLFGSIQKWTIHHYQAIDRIVSNCFTHSWMHELSLGMRGFG